ncbi:hypothetical protein FM107_06145 [Sphingobacterium sp. JB170]|nr:hypothetical protein FM107_06145 [Sphingobacterium sp. JB170]
MISSYGTSIVSYYRGIDMRNGFADSNESIEWHFEFLRN